MIAKGYKEYEFRTWKTKYRGEILIHSSKGIDKKTAHRFKHLNLEYPTSQIIAKAKLTNCIYVDDEFSKEMYKKDPLVYNKGLTENENCYGFVFKLENRTN